MYDPSTIVALSSSEGHAARYVLRLSGPQSLSIASSLAPTFAPAPSSATRHALHLRNLSFPSWIYCFLSPHSYTGEDLIELHLPGNPVLLRLLLDHALAHGARPAEPGEFTARAYFNGRLDLTAAEGVAAIVSASSEQQLAAGRQLLAGALANRLHPITDRVAETLALLEVGIDFSEEDVTFIDHTAVAARASSAESDLAKLIEHSDRLERLSTTPVIVLTGRPNAGKSTLLNTLAGHHRAVVSDTPGTTRDTLSANILLPHGIATLIDIAGLDDSTASSSDPIESAMRRRALQAIESADLLVLVIESTDPRPPLTLPRPPDLTLHTKSDLHPQSNGISSHTGAGLDQLRSTLDTLAFQKKGDGSHTSPESLDKLALNRRHLAALGDACASLSRAASAAQQNLGPEFIAVELRDALDHLGSITGIMSPDDVLSLVFSRFCIGK